MTSVLFGEKYLSKVAAQFSTRAAVHQAAERLAKEAGVDASHILVVDPNDPAIDNKLEPETRGIGKTLAKSHVSLGFSGLLIGLATALTLELTGVAAFRWNPIYTYLVFGFFGAIIGLLLGGLVSLRPDQGRLISWVKDGMRSGNWFILVHAQDHAEEQSAREALKKMSTRVVATF